MRLRALAALGLASLGLAFLIPATSAQAAPAAPRAYPVTVCSTLSVSTQNPAVGASITVTGTNFTANASVHLVLKSIAPKASSFVQQRAVTSAAKTYDLGTVKASAAGSFSTVITLPASITNTGRYYIYALTGSVSGSSCPADPFQALDIQAVAAASSSAPASTNGGGGLASTGLDIAGLVAIAALLVGGGFLINRRGRRSATRV